MYTIEYYMALEKEGTLPSARTWMNSEDTMLSEISQPLEDMSCTFIEREENCDFQGLEVDRKSLFHKYSFLFKRKLIPNALLHGWG